jgi:hypothetical protein
MLARRSNSTFSDDITWHAGPFNTEVETMDEDLFDFSMELSTSLDVQVASVSSLTTRVISDFWTSLQFGKEPKTVFSLKDVPGMTRGAVPVLAKRNVQLIHVGVNDETSPPAVYIPDQCSFISSSDFLFLLLLLL